MTTIDIGRIQVTSDLSLRSYASTKSNGGQPDPSTVMSSVEAAETSAGFKVFRPSWLPSQSLKPVHIQLTLAPTVSSRRVIGVVQYYNEREGHWLLLDQFLVDGTKLTVANAISQGNIGRFPAAFFTSSVLAANVPGGHLQVLSCLWEQSGFVMRISSAGYTQDEIARVGASLG